MDTNNNKYGSDVIEIDLMEAAGLLWHRMWLIVICALLAGALGFILSRFVVTEQYRSTTKIYVLNRQNDNTLTYSDVQLGTQLTKDFPELIKSRYVVEQVIAAWELPYSYEKLAGKIDVSSQTDTRIIAITVTDEDPQMARQLADEVRKVASERIKSVMDIQAVNVVDEANLPDHPASPNVGRWTVFGALIGAFLCAAIVLVHFMLDDTVKTADDIEKYLGLSTLGMIPEREAAEKAHRTAGHGSRSGEKTEHDFPKRENTGFADMLIRRKENGGMTGGTVSGTECKAVLEESGKKPAVGSEELEKELTAVPEIPEKESAAVPEKEDMAIPQLTGTITAMERSGQGQPERADQRRPETAEWREPEGTAILKREKAGSRTAGAAAETLDMEAASDETDRTVPDLEEIELEEIDIMETGSVNGLCKKVNVITETENGKSQNTTGKLKRRGNR